jgi:hypothetical protein
MSEVAQKQTSYRRPLMSALPPKADIGTQPRDVRFVPKADSCTAAKAQHVGRQREPPWTYFPGPATLPVFGLTKCTHAHPVQVIERESRVFGRIVSNPAFYLEASIGASVKKRRHRDRLCGVGNDAGRGADQWRVTPWRRPG